MNKLITTNNEIRMSSKELCELINMFRIEEGNDTEKRHDVLLRDIDNEIKTLQNVGIPTFHNFVESSYKEGNRNYRCYSLTKKGAMQILNKESAVVRYKTQQYIEQLEEQLMANLLPVPEQPQLIGKTNPYDNYLIKKNINRLDAADIPRYVNQVLEQAKDYTPSERLNTYQLTRTALEDLLPTLIESYDIAMVRASLDKLNKLIERQKTYINRSKLGQATKTINKLQDTIHYYELDSYADYYMVDIHGFTVNCSYFASNNEIKCTKAYKNWKNSAGAKMQSLPTLEELNLDPTMPKKVDIFFYLKDETFDVSNCTKSFLDAIQAHYKKEYPDFNDNVFADVRTRKYFSYSGSYEDGYIIFGIKDLTDKEIKDLTFNNDIEE